MGETGGAGKETTKKVGRRIRYAQYARDCGFFDSIFRCYLYYESVRVEICFKYNLFFEMIIVFFRYIYPVPIGILISTIWCTVVCLSRLYLGMHSVLVSQSKLPKV
jgi:hypothetical protein